MSVRSELVIKRPEGNAVKIEVNLWFDYGKPNYSETVYHRAKGKRKWIPALDTDDYRYRRSEDREAYKSAKELKHVTASEIHEAKIKVWESIKPEGIE